jgi:hypothetical protein
MKFELRTLHFRAGAQPLEPYLQFILLWLFWRWDLVNYFSEVTLAVIPRFTGRSSQ